MDGVREPPKRIRFVVLTDLNDLTEVFAAVAGHHALEKLQDKKDVDDPNR